MHATIPSLPQGILHLIQSGADKVELPGKLESLVDRTAGRLVAASMATLIKLGFGFLVSEGLDDEKERKAVAFFNENFVIRDPNAPGGTRFYQGQFLIRTKKPDDDMNVYIRFCPEPDKLFHNTPTGRRLNPTAIVTAEAISEEQARRIEVDPEQMDLVIRFKDLQAILSLLRRPDADVVQLLLENLMQITGNFGHMFKFGAIAKNAQLAVTGER